MFRSLMFIPGNRINMLEKSLTISPDVYIPDMEDSVPINRKDEARNIIEGFLPNMTIKNNIVIPRVNSLNSGFFEEDVRAVLNHKIYGISVGKINTVEDIKNVSNILDKYEALKKIKQSSIKIIPWIETALGVSNAFEICRSSLRIKAVAFGAEDFTNDIGVKRSIDGFEIDYPRKLIVIAAKAAGIEALDTPYTNFKDSEGLRKDIHIVKRLGYSGKFAIHPSQVEIIDKEFYPSEEEIENAKHVIETFKDAEKNGHGSTSFKGQMIDIPVVERAKKVLENLKIFEGK